jgi:hypothetical protein
MPVRRRRKLSSSLHHGPPEEAAAADVDAVQQQRRLRGEVCGRAGLQSRRLAAACWQHGAAAGGTRRPHCHAPPPAPANPPARAGGAAGTPRAQCPPRCCGQRRGARRLGGWGRREGRGEEREVGWQQRRASGKRAARKLGGCERSGTSGAGCPHPCTLLVGPAPSPATPLPPCSLMLAARVKREATVSQAACPGCCPSTGGSPATAGNPASCRAAGRRVGECGGMSGGSSKLQQVGED